MKLSDFITNLDTYPTGYIDGSLNTVNSSIIIIDSSLNDLYTQLGNISTALTAILG